MLAGFGPPDHDGNMLRCLALCLAVLASPALAAAETRIEGVARVTDGDTLSLGPVIIRLHGIDAPEAGQTCLGAAGRRWDCGSAATNRLAELVDGQSVSCLALDRDAYGRIVAQCRAGAQDLAARLIAEGLGWAFLRYSDAYIAAEAAAREKQVGIWAGENEAPWDYRANRWARAAAEAPRPGCPIKGNISNKGEKIYHTPWSPHYARTRIDEEKGERWFCDEAEAVAAGWHAARWR